jgi:hypothetical protein
LSPVEGFPKNETWGVPKLQFFDPSGNYLFIFRVQSVKNDTFLRHGVLTNSSPPLAGMQCPPHQYPSLALLKIHIGSDLGVTPENAGLFCAGRNARPTSAQGVFLTTLQIPPKNPFLTLRKDKLCIKHGQNVIPANLSQYPKK